MHSASQQCCSGVGSMAGSDWRQQAGRVPSTDGLDAGDIAAQDFCLVRPGDTAADL